MLPMNRAPGPDGLTARHFNPKCVNIYYKIFQTWAQNRAISWERNDSLIVPVFKKGDKDDPSNYRSIALINTVVKIFELAILNILKSSILLIKTNITSH